MSRCSVCRRDLSKLPHSPGCNRARRGHACSDGTRERMRAAGEARNERSQPPGPNGDARFALARQRLAQADAERSAWLDRAAREEPWG